MEHRSPERAPLTRLGIIGLSRIEAPVLAALATKSPLLLIGPHGTAKSLLLTRIAAALRIDFRHYNASLRDGVTLATPTTHGLTPLGSNAAKPPFTL